jgi:hypothetical protein
MISEVFYEFIANVFLSIFLFSRGNNFLWCCLLLAKSYLTYQLSVLCNELKIEVIALYPNDTKILQLADVAVLHPVRMYWQKAVRNWHAKHPGEVLNKVTFAPLLREAINSAAKLETLIKGFQPYGLYPVNANAVDYTKCLGKNATSRPRHINENIGRQDPSTIKVMKLLL